MESKPETMRREIRYGIKACKQKDDNTPRLPHQSPCPSANFQLWLYTVCVATITLQLIVRSDFDAAMCLLSRKWEKPWMTDASVCDIAATQCDINHTQLLVSKPDNRLHTQASNTMHHAHIFSCYPRKWYQRYDCLEWHHHATHAKDINNILIAMFDGTRLIRAKWLLRKLITELIC